MAWPKPEQAQQQVNEGTTEGLQRQANSPIADAVQQPGEASGMQDQVRIEEDCTRCQDPFCIPIIMMPMPMRFTGIAVLMVAIEIYVSINNSESTRATCTGIGIGICICIPK